MAHILGKNLRIKIGSTSSTIYIGAAKTCELSIENETIEIASPSSGQCKEFIKGRSSWSVSASGIVKVGNKGETFQLLNLIGNTANLYLEFEVGDHTFTGYVICTSAKYTGTVGNLAEQSATFQGTGSYTYE